jgi:hypothetical protein
MLNSFNMMQNDIDVADDDYLNPAIVTAIQSNRQVE